ncbi:MAG: Smr/MutS family protein [bacterium]|nr:Smr/MutS family protein [bacterium]
MKEKPPSTHNSSNDYEALVFSAELGETEQIDLHGLPTDQARPELTSFLHHSFMEGVEVVKIIHGRGTQRLKEMVEKMLRDETIIEYFRTSNNPSEMNAVIYAVIAKRK